ncbi:secreted protein containing Peptidoglycan binding-like domain protein [Candidatus Magnetomorum sp. HK-1]|nr:secreted protein containing Peptidoglycan binding-like domain protein [Candidatus Magnetomorum sp. HK-1]
MRRSKKLFTILLLAFFLLFISLNAYSKCRHTGSGRSPGRMGSGTFKSLMGMAVAEGVGTYFFKVQKNDGFYGKVCNEPEQITHFEEDYSLENGYWFCSAVDEDNASSYYDLDGIYRFEKRSDSLINACKYSNSTRYIKLTQPYIQGTDVKRLQQKLRIRGYNVDNDGIYGPGTKKAVKELQKSMDLKADGIVGPSTYRALNF